MKKLICVIMALLMVAAVFAGCGAQTPAATDAPETKAPETKAPETKTPETAAPDEGNDGPDAEEDPLKINLPIVDSPVYVSLWTTVNPTAMTFIDNLDDNLTWAKIFENTNIYFESTCVAGNVGKDQFNILVGGGELPDVLGGVKNFYTGGMVNAYTDEIIIDLKDLIDEYCPNYLARLDEYGAYNATLTDEGNALSIYRIIGSSVSDKGLALRTDWLKEFNMSMPETFDELHDYMAAAKEKYDATIYLNYIGMTNENEFNAGFGTSIFYNTTASTYPAIVRDGKVELSWQSDGYREYLEMMNEWYSEGLVWKDFPTGVKGWITLNDGALSEFLGGRISVAQMEMGDITALPQQAHEGQSGMTLAALPCPVKNAGDKIHVKGATNAASPGWCITTACSDENTVYALKLLDYLYSDEGALLSTFGIEGETYEMKDGVPVYTDLILNDPDGRAVKTMINIYCVDDMPQFVMAEKNQSLYTAEQMEASDTWKSNLDGEWQYPGGSISMTADEAGALGDLIGDLETYVYENMVKFIVGEKDPADDAQWAEFQKMIVDMKGDELRTVLQNAYDRFLKR